MAYEPTQWKTGDVVTSAKLNKLEQGVAEAGGGGAGIFWVNGEFQEDDSLTLDKTYSEIKAAFNGGEMVVLKTTVFDDEAQDTSLYYLTSCGGNIIFNAMPNVTSDAVYGSVITIYDDDSVVVESRPDIGNVIPST